MTREKLAQRAEAQKTYRLLSTELPRADACRYCPSISNLRRTMPWPGLYVVPCTHHGYHPGDVWDSIERMAALTWGRWHFLRPWVYITDTKKMPDAAELQRLNAAAVAQKVRSVLIVSPLAIRE